METNDRESIATTAIRVVKDTAWLIFKQASLKTLQLTSLFNADLATGKKAFAISFGRETFPDLFNSVEDLDREIERKRAAEPADAHETIVDRTKRLARECKKRLDIETLLRKRKKLLATIGRSVREPDLASAEAIKDEITKAQAIGAKASALAKEIEVVSARQPSWMRSNTTVLAVVLAIVLLLAFWKSMGGMLLNLIVYIGIAYWVYYDAKSRQQSRKVAWSVASAIVGPLAVPFYLAKRNLKTNEVREGGTAWNVVKYFAMFWTITMFILGISAILSADDVTQSVHSDAERAGAAIGTAIGMAMIFFLWFFVCAGALMIGFFLKKSSIVEVGPTGPMASAITETAV